jgi:small subunit ribosomal protein S20
VANTKSAEKRHRQSLKRRARNLHWRSTVKTAIKKSREATAAAAATKDPAKAKELLKAAERTLKKAASKGAVHPRNAQRHVARLAKAVAAVK